MFQAACTSFRSHGGGAFKKAFDNIEADRCCPAAPHGNIPTACQTALDAACKPPPAGFDAFTQVVEAHHSPRPASGAAPRNTGGLPVRRVVSRTEFIRFHLLDNGTSGRGPGRDRLRNLTSSIERLDNAGAPTARRLPVNVFFGRTGRPDAVTWWTFDGVRPDTGRDYIAALALPNAPVHAGRSNGMMEIEFPEACLPVTLFKPTALDGFYADTKFVPELTGLGHGMTAGGRKELVGLSFAYGEIADRGLYLQATFVPY